MATSSKDFKSIVVTVSDEDKDNAKCALIRQGKKPTYRNCSKLLKEWAQLGIIIGSKNVR